jgi:hypothetical protein
MTITLKNIPAQLHRTLKRQAKANKRSLSQDIIKTLEDRVNREEAFAKAIRYRNELAREGVRIPKSLAPERIIRQLRDGR